MEITGPNSLWKDYEVMALPFNECALSEKTAYNARVLEYYFDGYTTIDGRARAFLRIYEKTDAKGVVLYMSDADGENADIVKCILDNGYSVAALDYLGRSETPGRFTLYPASLDICNSRGVDSYMLPENTLYNQWFIWACIARRAICLLKKLYDKKLFALGVGLGGSTVYKLAAFDDGLCACATLLNIIPTVTGSGNSLINYRASLEDSAYAAICKIPLFMGICSNAEDGSADNMSNLANDTQSLKILRVLERSFDCGISALCKEVSQFFDGEKIPNMRPIMTASNSEGKLYLNVSIQEKEDVKYNYTFKLYVSFCMETPMYRNWTTIPAIGLGDTYMAYVNVCQETKPIFAFANLTFDNGTVLSTPIIKTIPKMLGIKGRPGVSHRRIYDNGMGRDSWMSRKNGKITLEKGPFDIDGVKSSNGSLITFKPGDPLFRVPADTLLQIMVSGKPQTIDVITRDENNTYQCQIQITDSNVWNKFSLSNINFKSANGPLFDWSQIIMLEFSSSEEYILGSVLWV